MNPFTLSTRPWKSSEAPSVMPTYPLRWPPMVYDASWPENIQKPKAVLSRRPMGRYLADDRVRIAGVDGRRGVSADPDGRTPPVARTDGAIDPPVARTGGAWWPYFKNWMPSLSSYCAGRRHTRRSSTRSMSTCSAMYMKKTTYMKGIPELKMRHASHMERISPKRSERRKRGPMKMRSHSFCVSFAYRFRSTVLRTKRVAEAPRTGTARRVTLDCLHMKCHQWLKYPCSGLVAALAHSVSTMLAPTCWYHRYEKSVAHSKVRRPRSS